MTRFTLRLGLTLLVSTLALSAFSSTASAAMDSAEICNSQDGRQRVARPFGEPKAFFAEVGRDPRAQPTVKEGYSYTKDPEGFALKNPVDPEMFELMAEPFGGTLQPKVKWTATFEGYFEGNVKVFDDIGRHVGTYLMTCNSAVVEYN